MKMKRARLAGFHIALVAMLLRAFLPQGWMPAPPGDQADANWIPFVICTGDGLVRLDTLPGSEHKQDQQTHHVAPCPYAAAAHLSGPSADGAIELYDAAFLATLPLGAAATPVIRDVFQRQRSRAPPLLTV
ncbi:MAG: hypothetical protein GC184_14265 [Rhizobiales bacterium]|nr:hypothetical protein [Hyphomicrobiales bacterium]